MRKLAESTPAAPEAAAAVGCEVAQIVRSIVFVAGEEPVLCLAPAIACRSTMTGTHDGEYKGIPPAGRHVSAESAEVFRIADGKFAGYWCLAKVAGLMRQLTEEPVTAGSAD